MSFKLVRADDRFLLPGTFLKKFEYSNDSERQYVRHMVKYARNNHSRIHLFLGKDNSPHGFIALSVTFLLKQPCVKIDYLFTSLSHRGRIFADTRGKISQHLLNFAIATATDIDQKVPITYVALLPVHDRLIPFYQAWGFDSLDKSDWLYLRI